MSFMKMITTTQLLLMIAAALFSGCKKDSTVESPTVIKEFKAPEKGDYLFNQDVVDAFPSIAAYDEVTMTSKDTTSKVSIDASNGIAYVSKYLFALNLNCYNGTVADQAALIGHLKNLRLGLFRGPGGSISDIYFWDKSVDNPPVDVPAKLAGQSDQFQPWMGKRPHSWESWAMDIDSVYSVIRKTSTTGMLTANYGYARYGTSDKPVTSAAQMAASWVRYDKGRSKFWEIGNEVNGSWEASYKIDPTLNKDGQPEIITPSLYGKHCKEYLDSMRKAANSVGSSIFIGAVVAENSTSDNGWNSPLMQSIGNDIDYYIIHSYFTPYNQNSTIETILNSPSQIKGYKTYVEGQMKTAGVPVKPIALTEYNTFATGSKQNVSSVAGMFSVLVVGEAAKNKIGVAVRWDLSNGWSNGDDHGMFSYNEPGVDNFTPYPAFYYQYFLRKCFGAYLIESSGTKSSLLSYATRFTTGELGIVVVNKSRVAEVTQLDIQNFASGNRCYYYQLVGGDDNGGFSRKVYVNGSTTTGSVGGPSNYSQLKPRSIAYQKGLKMELPPLSVTYILIPQSIAKD